MPYKPWNDPVMIAKNNESIRVDLTWIEKILLFMRSWEWIS